MRKPYQIRQVTKPGSCTHCGKPATKEAMFKEDGVVLIEKYCDGCIEPKAFERLQAIYSRVC